jgi:hypothetical protein
MGLGVPIRGDTFHIVLTSPTFAADITGQVYQGFGALTVGGEITFSGSDCGGATSPLTVNWETTHR